MMKILIISFLVWLSPIRAQLQVINSTAITNSIRGCLQSGIVLQGLLQISNPNDSLSAVPSNGLCPNGTILIGPSVIINYPNRTLIESGLNPKCSKNGLLTFGLAQSSQPLIASSNCSQTSGVFLDEDNVLQTVVSDQAPYVPESPISFNRSEIDFCVRSAAVTEGVVIDVVNAVEAINEACPVGQMLLKPGVVLIKTGEEPSVLNSSTCIDSGQIQSGRVFVQGEQRLLSQSFVDGTSCDYLTTTVLVIRGRVIILLELPTVSTIATITSHIFQTPLSLSSTFFSTITSTVLLTRTQTYLSYPDIDNESKQPQGYGSSGSMRPSGYLPRRSGNPPRRDKSFRFYPFDNKPKMNVDAIINAKIKNRLGNY